MGLCSSFSYLLRTSYKKENLALDLQRYICLKRLTIRKINKYHNKHWPLYIFFLRKWLSSYGPFLRGHYWDQQNKIENNLYWCKIRPVLWPFCCRVISFGQIFMTLTIYLPIEGRNIITGRSCLWSQMICSASPFVNV